MKHIAVYTRYRGKISMERFLSYCHVMISLWHFIFIVVCPSRSWYRGLHFASELGRVESIHLGNLSSADGLLNLDTPSDLSFCHCGNWCARVWFRSRPFPSSPPQLRHGSLALLSYPWCQIAFVVAAVALCHMHELLCASCVSCPVKNSWRKGPGEGCISVSRQVLSRRNVGVRGD